MPKNNESLSALNALRAQLVAAQRIQDNHAQVQAIKTQIRTLKEDHKPKKAKLDKKRNENLKKNKTKPPQLEITAPNTTPEVIHIQKPTPVTPFPHAEERISEIQSNIKRLQAEMLSHEARTEKGIKQALLEEINYWRKEIKKVRENPQNPFL